MQTLGNAGEWYILLWYCDFRANSDVKVVSWDHHVPGTSRGCKIRDGGRSQTSHSGWERHQVFGEEYRFKQDDGKIANLSSSLTL